MTAHRDSAQELQDEMMASAWARFEALAPASVQEQLKAVPGLRVVVETGINLGMAVAFEKAMSDDAHYAPVHKSMLRDIHDLVAFARRTNKRVLSLRAIERLLVKYRVS
jgi:hypothetical protein